MFAAMCLKKAYLAHSYFHWPSSEAGLQVAKESIYDCCQHLTQAANRAVATFRGEERHIRDTPGVSG
jgi:hypothetical protein